MKKIASILPVEIKFGPAGWTGGENGASKNEKLLVCEKRVVPDLAANDLTSRVLPQSIPASNSTAAEKFSVQGREDGETIRCLNNQSESASLSGSVGGMRPVVPIQLQQNSMVQSCINGPSSGPDPYNQPQLGIVKPTTLTGERSQADASGPSQMSGMVSTGRNTAFTNDMDASESNLLITASRADHGNFLPHGPSSFGSFRVPESGFVGEESLRGLAMQHRLDSHYPGPSESGGKFRATASSSSPQQPDLALQLRMGR